MLKIAIVDDLERDASRLQDLISEYAEMNRIDLDIRCFDCAEDLLSEIRAHSDGTAADAEGSFANGQEAGSAGHYDAVFLDIYMKEMSGIEAAANLRRLGYDMLIVFQTTSKEHMPEAFRLHAYDYIEKPAARSRIFGLMDDITASLHERALVPSLEFMSGGQKHLLPYDEIISLSSDGHYIDIAARGGARFRTRMTMTSVNDLLEHDSRFLSVIRGVVVNLDHVTSIADGICYLSDGSTQPVNIRGRKQIEQIWKDHLISRLRSESMRKSRRD